MENSCGSGNKWANMAEVRAHETVNKKSELRELFEGLNQRVGGKHSHVVQLVNAELIHIVMFITAVL